MKTGKYLGRHGKIYGPFSEKEFEQFHESGKIYEFSWIWDENINNWKSLDPAPVAKPPIYEQVDEPVQDNVVSLSPQKAIREFDGEQISSKASNLQAGKVAQKSSHLQVSNTGYQALCHNFRFAVSGEINSMTETSCELRIDLASGRVFPKNTELLLNIYDPKSGKSVNVKAKLIDSVREGDNWFYHMRWQSRPDFKNSGSN